MEKNRIFVRLYYTIFTASCQPKTIFSKEVFYLKVYLAPDCWERARAVSIEAVLDRLYPGLLSGQNNSHQVRCPLHEGDNTPSFTIYPDTNSFYCFGCQEGGSPIDLVMKAKKYDPLEALLWLNNEFCLGVAGDELKPADPKAVVAEYCYTDRDGTPKFKKLRHADKSFQWMVWDGKGWRYRTKEEKKDKIPYLFNLPVLAHTDTVVLCEGEKDLETLTYLGVPAVCCPAGANWDDMFAHFLADKNVILWGDNDEPGEHYVKSAAFGLSGVARSVSLVVWRDIHPDRLHEGADATDLVRYKGLKDDVLRELIKHKARPFALWYNDGQNPRSPFSFIHPGEGELVHIQGTASNYKPGLNEVEFARLFPRGSDLRYIDGRFYDLNGTVSDNSLTNRIYNDLAPFFGSKVPEKVKRCLDCLKYRYTCPAPEPDPDSIHLNNGTITLKGKSFEFSPVREFTLNRLAVSYDPKAPKPVKWLNFLAELLAPEDIEVLRQWFGYCLVPTCKAQVAMFLVGQGGEGKSVVGSVLSALLGSANCSSVKLHELGVDKFSTFNLAGRLVNIDDDLGGGKLGDVGTFKAVVTADKPLSVQGKYVNRQEARIFTRLFSCGNNPVGSREDFSDGFYRRLLYLQTLPVPAGRVPDRELTGKLLKELPGIFNWALEGLLTLRTAGFNFKPSERSRQINRELFASDNPVREFLDTLADGRLKSGGTIEFSVLYDIYNQWCDDLGAEKFSKIIFSRELKRSGLTEHTNYKNTEGRHVTAYDGISVFIPLS
jgi:putative DNA primase/helicase